jgi:hypothetical protein
MIETHRLMMYAACGMSYEVHRGDIDTCRAVMEQRVKKHDGEVIRHNPNSVELCDPGTRLISHLDGVLSIETLEKEEDDG